MKKDHYKVRLEMLWEEFFGSRNIDWDYSPEISTLPNRLLSLLREAEERGASSNREYLPCCGGGGHINGCLGE